MYKIIFVLCFATTSAYAGNHEPPLEVHQTLVTENAQEKIAALTLDACSGEYDARMMAFLIEHKIPATLFVTKRWLDKNPAAFAEIKSHPELFEIETHGARHIPAVVGKDRHVFGIAGSPDLEHLKQEVAGGAQAVEKLGVTKPKPA